MYVYTYMNVKLKKIITTWELEKNYRYISIYHAIKQNYCYLINGKLE